MMYGFSTSPALPGEGPDYVEPDYLEFTITTSKDPNNSAETTNPLINPSYTLRTRISPFGISH